MRFVVEIRKQLGLAPADFARKLGISPQSLHRIENHATERIGIPNLMAIWHASELSADDFIRLLEREERLIAKRKKDRRSES
jgi:transcriptional regulator with XRE-family HTH domain